MTTLEANIDGLVGPTHNYAGLSYGNVASEKHAQERSNPRAAALQGLAKMKFLHDLGIPQLVMPPQPRPCIPVLRRLGYKALADVPLALLGQVMSASAMWAANAATVSASADTADGKVHFTPANLITKFHRSIEPPVTAQYLKQIFPGDCFVHHDPLPAHALFSDEGAANHMRLEAKGKGTEIFVYGGAAKKFPARQARGASEAIIRLHGVKSAVLLEQSAAAIDAGVFHNDVIAMSNGGLLIYHEKAYVKNPPLHSPRKRGEKEGGNFTLLKIKEKDLPLKIAVATYFFNSQLVTLPGGGMAVIAPVECMENRKARACLMRLEAQGHVKAVHFLDVRESMKNGGGPACLRLRVALTGAERGAVHAPAWLDGALYKALCQWIESHYRDRMLLKDLRDPKLEDESGRALGALATILKIHIGQ